jgi:hypothetical protein
MAPVAGSTEVCVSWDSGVRRSVFVGALSGMWLVSVKLFSH